MKKISLLSAIALIAAAGSASAGEIGGFYFKGGIGYEMAPGKMKFKSQGYVPTGSSADTTAGTDITYGPPMELSGEVLSGESVNSKNFSGISFSAGLGYKITDALRTDLSFDYKAKQKAKFSIPAGAYLTPSQTNATALPDVVTDPVVSAVADGKNTQLINHEFSRDSWVIMMSLYYDFINTSNFIPFVNGGLGYSSVKNKGLVDTSSTPANKNVDNHTKSKSSFAWSVGGGVAYKISDGMYTDIAYKLTGMKAETVNADEAAMKGPAAGTAADEALGSQKAVIKMKTPELSHSINLGLRVEF